MTGSSGDGTVELRFEETAWSHFGPITSLAAACTVIAVLLGWAALWVVFGSGGLGVVVHMGSHLAGFGLAFVGLLFMLGAVFLWRLIVVQTAGTWRIWHRLRRPGAVLNGSGIHFDTRRGPTTVPWADAEQVVLRCEALDTETIRQVRLLVTPGAAVLHERRIRVPADRCLVVGLLPGDVDEAIRILRHLSGSRLVVDEGLPA